LSIVASTDFTKDILEDESDDNEALLLPLSQQSSSLSLSYSNLSDSSKGRHLLLISLLENIQAPYWVPRCHGHLRLYLPPSLAPPDQPPLVSTAQVLPNITDTGGTLLDRKKVVALLGSVEEFHVWPDTRYSRFNKSHRAALHGLVALLCTKGTSFDSMMSMLVVFKEFLPEEMFMDTIYKVVQRREDVGFIIPTVLSVQPQDFLPGAFLDKVAESVTNSSQTRRRRQAFSWADGWRRSQVEVYWHHGEYRTMPEEEPEGRLWYFNEDPLVNAQHYHWHQVLSSETVAGSWIHSDNLHRRGEMFYFMHRQLLARINNERLSVGLNITQPYGPDRWDKPVYPGYDPKLGRGSVTRFAPRPGGVTLSPGWVAELRKDLGKVRDVISEGVLYLGTREVKMEYKDGVDMGISALGDVVESYVDSRYGSLHNLGHTMIANLHNGVGEGVLNSPNVAVRDPMFGQWHQFVDNEFQKYKKGLGHYQDEDLDFPGVNVTSVTLQTVTPEAPNSLTTYMNHRASIQLNSIDLTQAGGRSVLIRYSRLITVPFSYTITVTSNHNMAEGMVRIFLIPAAKYLSPGSDITQLAIEMDRFYVSLNQGNNTIVRQNTESAFIAKHRDTLYELQERLLWGSLTQDQFNWAGCGWPEEMSLPRGQESGAEYSVLLVLSPLLPGDTAGAAWARLDQQSWAWCGVRKDRGGMPDSRPMGFPLDRPPPGGNWSSLLFSDSRARGNMAVTPVTITHLPDPWGQGRGR